MYRFVMAIGDWSNDGHGLSAYRRDREHVKGYAYASM